MHRDAPAGERVSDQIRGSLLLEAQLRMRMNVAPQGLHRCSFSTDRFNQFHCGGSLSNTSAYSTPTAGPMWVAGNRVPSAMSRLKPTTTRKLRHSATKPALKPKT